MTAEGEVFDLDYSRYIYKFIQQKKISFEIEIEISSGRRTDERRPAMTLLHSPITNLSLVIVEFD